jgi:hypothetical protein
VRTLEKITESTAISIGALSIIAGGVFWLSTLYAKASASEIKIAAIEQKMEKKNEDDADFKREVIERLVRIEENVKKESRGK